MSLNVKSFNIQKINKEIEKSSPELQLYITKLKENAKGWEELCNKAINERNNLLSSKK